LSGSGRFRFHTPDLCVQPCQFFIALLQRVQFAVGFFAEGQHFLERRTVLPFQRLNQVQALLEFLQSRRIDFKLVAVARNLLMQVIEGGDGLPVLFGYGLRR